MRSAISIGGAQSGRERNWPDLVQYVAEAERMGVGDCWNAEAWGLDAVTPLAYLAGQTSSIRLGTSIAQISARVPSMTAMTALTMAAMSGDRFVLGLGVSGPQVVEGLQGVRFGRPLTRLREYLDILDLAFAGEKLRVRRLGLRPAPGRRRGQGTAAGPAGRTPRSRSTWPRSGRRAWS